MPNEIAIPERKVFPPTQAGKLVQLLEPLGDDLMSVVGKKPEDVEIFFSPKTEDFAHAAALHPIHLQRWMRSLLVVNPEGNFGPNAQNNAVKLYLSFLHRFSQIPISEIEDMVAQKLDLFPSQQQFITNLAGNHPLTAASTIFLLQKDEQKKKKSKKNPSAAGWYGKVVENTVNTDFAVSEFMRKMKYRQARIVGNPYVDAFLNDLEFDLRLNIAENLNVANTFAMFNYLHGSDAVMSQPMKVGVSRSDFRDVFGEIKALQVGKPYPDGRIPFYDGFGKANIDVNRTLTPDDGYLFMPISIGVSDTLRFSQFMREFWTTANSELESERPYYLPPDPRVSSINIGNSVGLFMRPFPDMYNGYVQAQARIGVQGRGKFKDLSIRVDCDHRHQTVSLDFGHVSAEDALKYARHLLEVDKIEAVPEVLSSFDKLNAFVRAHGLGPSVMSPVDSERNARRDPLSLNNKLSIMSSVIAGQGTETAMRVASVFGYHMVERVNRPIHLEKFPLYVHAMTDALTYSAA